MIRPDQKDILAEMAGAAESLKEAELGMTQNLLRLVVTSSYYAIFHAARAALWSRGRQTKTHRGLIREFSEEFVKSSELDRKFLDVLMRGHDARQAVDYDMIHYEVSRGEAEEIHDASRAFVDEMRRVIAKESSV